MSAVNVSGTNRLEALPGEVVGQPLGVGLDLGQLGHDGSSDVLGPLADVVEHGVEGAEHRLRVEQALLVAVQPDVAVDERLLGVELAGGDGHRGVPRLLHAHVLGLGGAGAEAGLAGADLEVVGDVALRAVRHDLGEADLVVARQTLAIARRRRRRVDSSSIHSRLRYRTRSDIGSVVCRIMTAPARSTSATTRPHPAAGGRGVAVHVLGGRRLHRARVRATGAPAPARAALVLGGARPAGEPLLHVTEWDVPPPRRSAARQGPRAVGRAHVRRPDGAVDGGQRDVRRARSTIPTDALGRAYGTPTAVAFDLEWYATGVAVAPAGATGTSRTASSTGSSSSPAAPLQLDEAPARRWHRWGDGARAGSRCPTPSPTPGCGRRSRSPTAPSPTGCSPRTAGARLPRAPVPAVRRDGGDGAR